MVNTRLAADAPRIEVSISDQSLILRTDDAVIASYSISTALNGPGQKANSGCTPLGKHHIRIKIGGGCPINAVFRGRRFTQEIYSPELAEKYPDRDWILTRILWLTGDDSGVNRGGDVDTLKRYIYIHGCPDSEPMGIAKSHGCVRMRNTDLIELFDQVSVGTVVTIS